LCQFEPQQLEKDSLWSVERIANASSCSKHLVGKGRKILKFPRYSGNIGRRAWGTKRSIVVYMGIVG
jgi:hypothetical protein